MSVAPADVARKEWHRLASPLFELDILTFADRAVLAAYCQTYGRWVGAEEKLKETPLLIRTSSGYIQQSSWLSITSRQMELMGRYMAEIGLTPAARLRIVVSGTTESPAKVDKVEIVVVWTGGDGITY